MLPKEQQANSRYFYEFASANLATRNPCLPDLRHFTSSADRELKRILEDICQAAKNIGRISEVRGIPEGQDAISPPIFPTSIPLSISPDSRIMYEK